MLTVQDRLTDIDRLVEKTVQVAAQDTGACPVLVAVVRELQRISKKAMDSFPKASAEKVREMVIEMEQAADSAKVAVEADVGCMAETRTIVNKAHDEINGLKQDLLGEDTS